MDGSPSNGDQNSHNLSEEEDDYEEISAAEALSVLTNAWAGEKAAPDLLPPKSHVVDLLLHQVHHMRNNLTKLPPNDIRLAPHTMELERIKFLITSYLRTRLAKIEKFALYLLSDECKENLLTDSEKQYAQNYAENMKNYYSSAVLQKMPGNMQNFDSNKMSIKPNLNSHVFLKALENVYGIVLESMDLEQDEEIDLESDSQHIMQYKMIADLVKTGKVQLL